MKAFRPLDFLILVIFLAFVAGSFYLVAGRRGSRPPFLVVNAPEGEYVYPMNKNRIIRIRGLLGDSVLVIEDGKAFFQESPCPNKTCVQTRPLEHNNDWAACLPNQVIIHVEADENGLDTITR
ncbi:MAG: NusG domain II-containing protein [Treponema sp.]|nr:NusG domain II-containing protein [Treponema sp.]